VKRSVFLNVIRGKREYLLHNTLYGTLVKAKCIVTKSIVDGLEKEELLKYDDNNPFHRVLKSSKMIVEDDVDELSILNRRYLEADMNILHIILFVTRQCNFRCKYCYEKHENKRMHSELYDNLMHAIIEEVGSKGYRTVVLSFFGGEPMLEYDEICAFMKKMQGFADSANVSIYGSMTTNAYLLTSEKLKRLVELNVLNYQITVDGPQETHDCKRFFIDGTGTWKRIIQNLNDAKRSNLNFEITIRTNFDADVIERIKEYLMFVFANFTNDKRFKVHFEAIKNLGEETVENLYKTNDESKAIEDIFSLTKELLHANSFNFGFAPFDYMCYASKRSSLAVDTDGTLRKCTVNIDSAENAVGKLLEKGFQIDESKMCAWTSYQLPKECRSCKVLPLCFGRKCPVRMKNQQIGGIEYCSALVSYYENSLKCLCQVC